MGIHRAQLVGYLKDTVTLLESSPHYEWGNSGACNCGHLAQVMTGHHKADLHRWALERDGDWTETARSYCENSGLPIDQVIDVMLSKGLQLEDIRHIEYLSHPDVLARIPGRSSLRHNQREDVILYFRAWAELLEQEGVTWEARRMLPQDRVAVHDSIPEPERG
ncbi:MAG: hypothetical protein VX899_18635 [Myxococcota bacterium]|nr:hypothetical protein [Myxococcota bacterium]